MRAKPTLDGPYTKEQEKAARYHLIDLLQRYAHKTNCLAGDDIIKHFLKECDKHARD